MTGKAIVVVMVKVVLSDMGIEMRATKVCVLYTEWCHLIQSFRYATKNGRDPDHGQYVNVNIMTSVWVCSVRACPYRPIHRTFSSSSSFNRASASLLRSAHESRSTSSVCIRLAR